MDLLPDNIKRKRFWWGVVLAWIPFFFLAIPTAIGVFRVLSREKATGLGAVAGGMGEIFSTFGLAAMVVSEVTAIILLLRSFSGDRPQRAIVSALSICCSGFMLAIVGLFLWRVFFLAAPLAPQSESDSRKFVTARSTGSGCWINSAWPSVRNFTWV